MTMLILETFLLLFVAAVLGRLAGGFAAARWAEPLARWAILTSPRPWLADGRPRPAVPELPPAPALLSDEARARLAAVAAATSAPMPESPPPAPEPLSPPPPPTVAAPEPVPAVAAPPPVAPPPPPIAAADLAKAAEADAHGTRPAGIATPAGDPPDDLELIKGIGPQNHARLNALGIYYFHQIAAWTPENARWVGSFLAFVGRIEREKWVAQAAAFAEEVAKKRGGR